MTFTFCIQNKCDETQFEEQKLCNGKKDRQKRMDGWMVQKLLDRVSYGTSLSIIKKSSSYYSLHSSPTEEWAARLRTEGRESPLESKQTQNWRNKEEGGIWNTWALWECQIGWTKANCHGWKVWNCDFLFGKDCQIMSQVIFPQTLGKALWATFTHRPFCVQAEWAGTLINWASIVSELAVWILIRSKWQKPFIF